MLYREIESVGETFIEKEYEGTPQEIAELINQKKSSKLEVNLNADYARIEEIVKQLGKQLAIDLRSKRIKGGR